MADLTLSDLLTPPTSADPKWFRSRGRSFERVLNQFLLNEEMEPHTSIRPKGEEIDGSFILDDRYFLLEAKWHKDPIPASDLYAFKGKVDGKLVGTIGVFFSMSDYSTEAVDALLKGKELNIILFGLNDLLSIENKKITMRESLKIKLRSAATYGLPFYSIESYLSNVITSTKLGKDQHSKRAWSIIVEGEEDVGTIKALLSRFDINSGFTIFPAGGQLSVPSLSAQLVSTGNTNVAAIVTPIKDPKVQSKQIAELESLEVEIINLPATLEDWLDNYVTTEYHNSVFFTSSSNGKMARRYARNANIDMLLSNNPLFNNLINKLKSIKL